MSIATRQWVCNNLTFTDDVQKSDLLDESLTSTDLIAFLQDLLQQRGGVWQGGKLEVLSVRSDHPTVDGPDGHNGGNAIDFAEVQDDALQHLIQDTQACTNARGIGLGGVFQNYADACGGYSAASKLFQDNDSEHIHVQVVGY